MMSSIEAKTIDRIHVVAGVIKDHDGRVLVAQRPAGKSMAGAWEFPGGKLAAGEGRLAGLIREFDEELGIHIEAARPLIRYRHRYPALDVDLDVWLIERWSGEPHGREGQAFGWYPPGELPAVGLLPADAAVVLAIRLPSLFAVTPPHAESGEEAFMDRLEAIANGGGPGLVCLRRPDLDPEALLDFAAGAACRVEGTNTQLIVHGNPAVLAPALVDPPRALAARFRNGVAGLHVPGRFLDTLTVRPVPTSLWFGASCHDSRELKAALALDADYAFLGPLKPTASHPGEPGMGWERFAELVRELPLPVYAIGGLGREDLETAWAAGAQGIAAIHGLWPR